VVLGLALVLLILEILAGVPTLLLLAPVCFVVCTLLPQARAIAVIWLSFLSMGLFISPDFALFRQSVAVGIVALFSPSGRTWFLRKEWEIATQRTLAELTQAEKAGSPEQSIAYALNTLRNLACADGAIVLRQLDGVTAEALICSPETALPSRLTTPALFAEAIAQNQCLYYVNYPDSHNAAPVLLSQGVKSLAVMPLQQPSNVQGAILLFWRRTTQPSPHLKQFIDSLRSGLGNLLRFQDLTLRLEKLQARLIAILETIPQGVVFIDESGNQGWVNQTAALQLGLPQGTVPPAAIAQAMTELRLRADNATDLTVQAAQLFSRPQVEIRDWQWHFSNPRQVLSFSSTPIRLRYVPGRLWVIHDITQQQQAQEELELQTRRTQLFAEVTLKIRQSLQIEEILQTTVTEVQKILGADRVLIYRLWPDGTGSSVSEKVLPGWPSVTGYIFPEEVFPEDMKQQYLQGRIGLIPDVENAPDVTPCLVDYLRQFNVKSKLVVPVITQGEVWGLLVAHQCTHPRQWTNFEIELQQQLANQIGIALTQAQLLEQEVRQRQELARSNTELQQFAYIASHDLQEPLRMVTSYLQLLERRYQHQLGTDADDFIAFAVDGATRMKALINDLLLFSRVGTHGKPFELTHCTPIVERAIANLKIAIEESQATVTYDALPIVLGDTIQLTQLFQNLIGNAIKFHGNAPPMIHIGVESHTHDWCFFVRDNGIGIEPDYLEQIFVIFQRLHRRTDYPGTGIGLAVCKKIVERHGGKIWVQSKVGNGSAFYFTLPRQGEPHHD
jgi:signal transduction histidine kinase